MIAYFKDGSPEWFEDEGWYYSDETEQLIGPYKTEEDAKQHQKDHAHWLDPQHPGT